MVFFQNFAGKGSATSSPNLATGLFDPTLHMSNAFGLRGHTYSKTFFFQIRVFV